MEAVKIVECNREQDVLDALTTGQWPERVDGDLRTHVTTCTLCTDLVAAVQPLIHERNHVPYEPRIPSSAVMWWRAQMRARQEAARAAGRPIAIAQIVGAAMATIVAVAALIVLSPWLITSMIGLDLPSGILAQGWLLPALAIGVFVLLTPVAIYFAVAGD
jgi:hypothetical protein